MATAAPCPSRTSPNARASASTTGFIKSIRGAHGGYRLARAARDISAYDVVTAMEGSIAPVSCVEDDHICDSQNVCGTQSLWYRVDAALRDVLGGTTLADLIEDSNRQQHARLVQIDPSYPHLG